MALHSFNLQKAIFTALDGNITDVNSAAIGGVYDDVPEGAAYPYVVIGEETQENVSTKSSDLHEHTLTIHVWSQYRGRREIKEIMAQVYDLLHDQSLSVTNAVLVDLKQEFSRDLVEGDGITRHGIMRFRAVVADS
jgi:hypothetical protein